MAARAPRLRRLAGVAACACVLVGWYLVLAPTRIGGPLTPVLVRGSSMLPTYETGDLVIAYRARSYEPGQVLAFLAPSGGVVIHRAVAVDGGRIVTRGDNRATTDPWPTTQDDALGSARLVIPGVGGAITVLSRPVPAGAVAGTIAFLVVLVPGSGRAPRTSRSPRSGRRRRAPAVVSLLAIVALPTTGFAAGLAVSVDQIAAMTYVGPFDTYVATPGGGAGSGGCNGSGNQPGC